MKCCGASNVDVIVIVVTVVLDAIFGRTELGRRRQTGEQRLEGRSRTDPATFAFFFTIIFHVVVVLVDFGQGLASLLARLLRRLRRWRGGGGGGQVDVGGLGGIGEGRELRVVEEGRRPGPVALVVAPLLGLFSLLVIALEHDLQLLVDFDVKVLIRFGGFDALLIALLAVIARLLILARRYSGVRSVPSPRFLRFRFRFCYSRFLVDPFSRWLLPHTRFVGLALSILCVPLSRFVLFPLFILLRRVGMGRRRERLLGLRERRVDVP